MDVSKIKYRHEEANKYRTPNIYFKSVYVA